MKWMIRTNDNLICRWNFPAERGCAQNREKIVGAQRGITHLSIIELETNERTNKQTLDLKCARTEGGVILSNPAAIHWLGPGTRGMLYALSSGYYARTPRANHADVYLITYSATIFYVYYQQSQRDDCQPVTTAAATPCQTHPTACHACAVWCNSVCNTTRAPDFKNVYTVLKHW